METTVIPLSLIAVAAYHQCGLHSLLYDLYVVPSAPTSLVSAPEPSSPSYMHPHGFTPASLCPSERHSSKTPLTPCLSYFSNVKHESLPSTEMRRFNRSIWCSAYGTTGRTGEWEYLKEEEDVLVERNLSQQATWPETILTTFASTSAPAPAMVLTPFVTPTLMLYSAFDGHLMDVGVVDDPRNDVVGGGLGSGSWEHEKSYCVVCTSLLAGLG
ncbi:hypothetical protein BJ165DRAFT_862066 [Panaeolus papilionaceus]|nr:hypothetical protein BJ165DRAFT_862066 [Panaeolus papilionaceus]